MRILFTVMGFVFVFGNQKAFAAWDTTSVQGTYETASKEACLTSSIELTANGVAKLTPVAPCGKPTDTCTGTYSVDASEILETTLACQRQVNVKHKLSLKGITPAQIAAGIEVPVDVTVQADTFPGVKIELKKVK